MKNINLVVLKNINLVINKGQFISVVGEVASGKTSLLTALVGGMYQVSGQY